MYFALGIGEMWIHSRVPEVMLHLEGRTTYGRNPCEEVGVIHPASGEENSWNIAAGQEGENGDKIWSWTPAMHNSALQMTIL